MYFLYHLLTEYFEGHRCRFPSYGRLVAITLGFVCFFGGISLILLIGLDPPCADCEEGPWIILGGLTIVAGFVLIALGFAAVCNRNPNSNLSVPYEQLNPEESTQELPAGTYIPYRPYESRTFQRWLGQLPDVQDTYQLTQQRQMTDGQQKAHQLSQQSNCEFTQHESENVQEIISTDSVDPVSNDESSIPNHQTGCSRSAMPLHTTQKCLQQTSIVNDDLLHLGLTTQQMKQNYSVGSINLQNVSQDPFLQLQNAELAYVSLGFIKEDITLN